MKIAVLGLGEAGSVFASGLAAGGAEVTGYDPLLLADAARFAALERKGVGVACTASEAVVGVDMIISLTSESAFEDAAASVKETIHSGQIYLDMNLISPLKKKRICDLLPGIDIVDGTIMKASVAKMKHKTRVYVAGAKGRETADVLCKLGLDVTFVDEKFGAACGIKLLRGIFMKSIETTLMESAHAAACLGISDSFLREICKAVQENTPFDSMLHDMITTCPDHASRHGTEIQETIPLLRSLGIDDTMTRAIADKFFYIDSLNLGKMVFHGQIPDEVDLVLSNLPKPLMEETCSA